MRGATALILLAVLLLAGGARAQETSATLRIVTCAPSLAEYVHFVGAFDRVVGVSRFTAFPPEAAGLPAVTDMQAPGLEGIEALRPTLVLCLQSNARVAEHFRTRPGVKVVQLGRVETFDEVAGALRTVARACGTVEAAAPRIAAFEARLADLRRARPPAPRRVLMLLGGPELRPGGVTAIGRGTYIDELLQLAGGENVLDESVGVYPQLNKEALLGLDPEVLLFLAEGDMPAADLEGARRSWAPLATMRAPRDPMGMRFLSDPRVMVPGPRALDALEGFRGAIGTPAAPATGTPVP